MAKASERVGAQLVSPAKNRIKWRHFGANYLRPCRVCRRELSKYVKTSSSHASCGVIGFDWQSNSKTVSFKFVTLTICALWFNICYVNDLRALFCISYINELRAPFCICYLNNLLALVCICYINDLSALFCVCYVNELRTLFCICMDNIHGICYVNDLRALVCICYVNNLRALLCICYINDLHALCVCFVNDLCALFCLLPLWPARSVLHLLYQWRSRCDLATERERQLTTGERAERTKRDFRCPVCYSAIGRASCQFTFPFCC